MYKCKICNFRGNKGELIGHVIQSHVNLECVPWLCDLCGYRSYARGTIIDHVKHVHWNAFRQRPIETIYIHSENPYIVKEGVDYVHVDYESRYNADDDNRYPKRKGSEPHPNWKRPRSDDQYGSRRYEPTGRDRCARYDYDVRERPDRPNYDMDDDDYHRYDSQQPNMAKHSSYRCSDYVEWSERHNRHQHQGSGQRNQSRHIQPPAQTRAGPNSNLEIRSGHHIVFDSSSDAQFSDEIHSSSDMEMSVGDTHCEDPGTQDHPSDSSVYASPATCSRLQPYIHNQTESKDGILEVTKSEHIPGILSPEITHRSQNILDSRHVPDHRSGEPLHSSITPLSDLKIKRLPEDESPHARQEAERVPASSSTVDRLAVHEEATGSTISANGSVGYPVGADCGDRRVITCHKNVDQSAEIGSTCGHKEKQSDVNQAEVTSQQEVQPDVSKETPVRRVSTRSERNSVGGPRTPPQTVLEDQNEFEEDVDEFTDSQVLEDKINELVSALEPLKNISKALIALDHHMRRLLPMVEHLVKESSASGTQKK